MKVKVKKEAGVSYTIQFIGADRNSTATQGKILKEVKGTEASYTLMKDDLYVRVKIISSKEKENPYQEGDVETAWTQPVR